jgi:broad specificity phosphatase PhoE
MPRIRLVRHGRAAAGFSDDADPGLDEIGRSQAVAMAATIAPLGPMPIVCSPLRRTLETAVPLREAWGPTAGFDVDGRVAEIPSPTDDLTERGAWLADAMAGTWADLGAALQAWRDALVEAVLALPVDTVVVSHFIAINAIVGRAIGDDRVMHSSFGNCSITMIDTGDSGDSGASVATGLTVVELGTEAGTRVW